MGYLNYNIVFLCNFHLFALFILFCSFLFLFFFICCLYFYSVVFIYCLRFLLVLYHFCVSFFLQLVLLLLHTYNVHTCLSHRITCFCRDFAAWFFFMLLSFHFISLLCLGCPRFLLYYFYYYLYDYYYYYLKYFICIWSMLWLVCRFCRSLRWTRFHIYPSFCAMYFYVKVALAERRLNNKRKFVFCINSENNVEKSGKLIGLFWHFLCSIWVFFSSFGRFGL